MRSSKCDTVEMKGFLFIVNIHGKYKQFSLSISGHCNYFDDFSNYLFLNTRKRFEILNLMENISMENY